jgi:hypothetical protein
MNVRRAAIAPSHQTRKPDPFGNEIVPTAADSKARLAAVEILG